MTDQDATAFISAMGTITTRELEVKIQMLATKGDIQATKNEINKLALITKDGIRDLNNKIYLSSLVQYFATIASILAILKFMKYTY